MAASRIVVFYIVIARLITETIETESNAFPVSQFFNTSLYDNISKYLCHGNASSERCCSCNKGCHGDCCIDALWDKNVHRNVEQYIGFFTSRYRNNEKKMVCRPIIFPMQHGHVSEHFSTITSYVNSKGTRKQCSDVDFDRLYDVPVLDEDIVYLYSSVKCAKLNGIDRNFPLNVTVQCKRATNVSSGMIFTTSLQNRLTGCVFKAIHTKHSPATSFNKCSNKLHKLCGSNRQEDLCNSYIASIYGYKNQHCRSCKIVFRYIPNCYKNQNEHLYSIDQTDNEKLDYPVSFQLKANINMQWVVQNFLYRFPVFDFLGIHWETNPSQFNAEGLLCSMHPSCCQCTLNCLKFNTCCMDILWNYTHPLSITAYQQLLVDTSKQTKEHQCEKVIPATVHYPRTTVAYLMVTKCPNNVQNTTTQDKCNDQTHSDTPSFVPVLGSDGYLYRNRFCARCNSVSMTIPVNVTVDCGRNSETIEIKDTCSFSIYLRELSNPLINLIRSLQCDLTLKMKCSTNNPNYELCKAYKGPVGSFYNFHCYRCSTTDRTHVVPVIMGPLDCRGLRTIQWSMLISFTPQSQIYDVRGVFHQKIYFDGNNGGIFNILKSPTVQPSSGISRYRLQPPSIPMIDKTVPDFDSCLFKTLPTIFIMIKGKRGPIAELIIESQLKIMKESIMMYSQDVNETIYKVLDTKFNNSLKSLNEYIRSMEQTLLNWNNDVRLLISQSDQPVLSNIHHLNFSHAFPKQRTCYKPVYRDVGSIHFSSTCGFKNNGINQDIMWNVSDITLLILLGNGSKKQLIATCDHFYMDRNCTLHDIHDDITVDDNGTLTVIGDSKQTYFVKEYIPLENGVAVCLSDYLAKTGIVHWLFMIRTIDVYASHIGSSLSVICYLVVAYTFCKFKNLQNIPGLCTLSLTLCLLCGDTMFLVAGVLKNTGYYHISSLCTTVAVLMHFGLVSSHAWAVIISLDLFVRFNKLKVIQPKRNRKKYWCYCFFSFIISSLIVGTSFVLDRLNIIISGYGTNGICITQTFYARLYFYVVPTVLSFTISSLVLAITLYKISRENKRNTEQLENSGRKNLNVALLVLKLILALGLTEGVGFIQITNQKLSGREMMFNQTMGLLYTIARSLRGVFLMIVYICKKDVFHLYGSKSECNRVTIKEETINRRLRFSSELQTGF